MLVVVDYGLGNLQSIVNMLARIGVSAVISRDPAKIAEADRIILPGVGAWDSGLRQIEERGLRDALDRHAKVAKKPTLGICLGMQLLFDASDEGDRAGLGWIPGRVVKFPSDLGVKVPHMGWNDVVPTREDALFTRRTDEVLFAEMEDGFSYYFVHSFHATCAEEHVLGNAFHGRPFAAIVRHENIYGAQFHPEKSHKHGMRLLKNFAELA